MRISIMTVLGVVACSTSVQAADWKYKVVANDWYWVADFINTECGTKDVSGVVGVISQGGGAGGNYNLHVWCRVDKAGGGWINDPATMGKGGVGIDSVVRPRLEAGNYVVLGFFDGSQQDAVLAVKKTGN